MRNRVFFVCVCAESESAVCGECWTDNGQVGCAWAGRFWLLHMGAQLPPACIWRVRIFWRGCDVSRHCAAAGCSSLCGCLYTKATDPLLWVAGTLLGGSLPVFPSACSCGMPATGAGMRGNPVYGWCVCVRAGQKVSAAAEWAMCHFIYSGRHRSGVCVLSGRGKGIASHWEVVAVGWG